MAKILIVGCGNIGSRHLQAIAKLSFPIDVEIVEPDEKNRTIAKTRLSEINFDKNKQNYSWYDSIQKTSISDLVIVATNAVPRFSLVEELLENGHKKFLLEKMVTQSISDYNVMLEKMTKFGAKGWINLAHRYFDFFIKLKNLVNSKESLHLSVVTGNWGIVGNAIHFLDLFAWLCNDYKIKLNGDNLMNKILPNKRGKKLIELAGTITASSTNESAFTLTFLPYEGLPYMINLVTDNFHLIVDETNNRVFPIRNCSPDLQHFTYQPVSQTTTKIAKDILETGECKLPKLSEIKFIHDELIRIFSQHLEKLTNKRETICPIT